MPSVRPVFTLVSASPATPFGPAFKRPVAGKIWNTPSDDIKVAGQLDHLLEAHPGIWDARIAEILDVSGQWRLDGANSVLMIAREDRLGMTRLWEYPLAESAERMRRDCARAGFGDIPVTVARPPFVQTVWNGARGLLQANRPA